jgi:hypothetical protein
MIQFITTLRLNEIKIITFNKFFCTFQWPLKNMSYDINWIFPKQGKKIKKKTLHNKKRENLVFKILINSLYSFRKSNFTISLSEQSYNRISRTCVQSTDR